MSSALGFLIKVFSSLARVSNRFSSRLKYFFSYILCAIYLLRTRRSLLLSNYFINSYERRYCSGGSLKKLSGKGSLLSRAFALSSSSRRQRCIALFLKPRSPMSSGFYLTYSRANSFCTYSALDSSKSLKAVISKFSIDPMRIILSFTSYSRSTCSLTLAASSCGSQCAILFFKGV